METNQIKFSGSIPQAYEDYLGPFLFEPFAFDLVQRLGTDKVKDILEVACGTGRVTRHLLDHLEESGVLTASDINPEMLAVARARIPATNILWDIVDMTDMPYPEDFFDVVVCQFGLMLVPDKEKALAQIMRVLRKDGRLIFNVWGDSKENGIWAIGMNVIGSFIGENPIPQNISPFSMKDEKETFKLLERCGFGEIRVDLVKKTGVIEYAALAAKGFIEGLPIATMLMQRDPSLIYKIEEALEKELTKQLGDKPLASPLLAWVFEAVK